MIGSHCSIAGGLHHAIDEAISLGLDCVQVFTKNQRQWSSKPLQRSEVDAWRASLSAAGWDGSRVVSHNSYLVNLANPDPAARARSLALQRDETERCEALGIPACVMHPGAHLGTPRKPRDPNRLGEAPTDEELDGLRRIASTCTITGCRRRMRKTWSSAAGRARSSGRPRCRSRTWTAAASPCR